MFCKRPRNLIFVGAFVAVALLFASFAGFLHNHSDDPFHTEQHETCPVTVWAHTAFDLFPAIVLFLAGAVVVSRLFTLPAFVVIDEYFFTQASRAPPVVL